MLHMRISRGASGSAVTIISFLQLTPSLCETRNQWYVEQAAMASTATEFMALDILFHKKCQHWTFINALTQTSFFLHDEFNIFCWEINGPINDLK